MAVCALAIVATAAKAQQPFTGTWRVRSSETAPWADNSYRPHFNPNLMHARIVIEPGRFDVPGNECQPPEYHIEPVPLNAILEGLLPQIPAKLTFWRKHLGFTDQPVLTLEMGCSDLLVHMGNQNTILFAVDKKQPGESDLLDQFVGYAGGTNT